MEDSPHNRSTASGFYAAATSCSHDRLYVNDSEWGLLLVHTSEPDIGGLRIRWPVVDWSERTGWLAGALVS